MLHQRSNVTIAATLAAALALTAGDARAAEEAKYPNWKGQWERFVGVGLPGRNGRWLAEEATQRLPNLKVLFTTGYARNAIVHQGRLDPGVELITKPFTYAALAHKIRQVLDA